MSTLHRRHHRPVAIGLSVVPSAMMNLLIGLLAGFAGGIAGIGGGVIMIPLMVGVLKMNQHAAHGTGLVVLIFSGLVGAITYGFNGSLDITAAALLATTAIFTARAGAKFAHALPEWKLRVYFGVFLIVVAILMLVKPYLPSIDGLITDWLKISFFLLAGSLIGLLSGMLGVGGGALMIPALVLFAGFSQYTAQGSSLLAMVPIGIVGAYTHWRLGNVNTSILPALIPGALLGSYLGSSWAHLLPEVALRAVFAVLLISTGIKHLQTPRPTLVEKETVPGGTE